MTTNELLVSTLVELEDDAERKSCWKDILAQFARAKKLDPPPIASKRLHPRASIFSSAFFHCEPPAIREAFETGVLSLLVRIEPPRIPPGSQMDEYVSPSVEIDFKNLAATEEEMSSECIVFKDPGRGSPATAFARNPAIGEFVPGRHLWKLPDRERERIRSCRSNPDLGTILARTLLLFGTNILVDLSFLGFAPYDEIRRAEKGMEANEEKNRRENEVIDETIGLDL